MDLSARLVAAVSPARSNPLDESRTPLAVLLLGPTGSGKTALSLALGERFGGEVVSCDSVAVYRGMDLGTAKPTREERARLPHHLIDVADPDQPFTAGEYSRQARTALGEIAAAATCLSSPAEPASTCEPSPMASLRDQSARMNCARGFKPAVSATAKVGCTGSLCGSIPPPPRASTPTTRPS